MSDLARLLLLLGFAGLVVTLGGSVAIWWMEESRRIRRALKKVLGAEAEALIIAQGRGRGAGFTFRTGLAAVTWDAGGWCLVYRIDELEGAEILVDGMVAARAFRGEPRRPLDQVPQEASRVTLRLIFDDPAHPDFDLDLWVAGEDEGRPDASPKAAAKEANRWMARAEAILRRPGLPRARPLSEPAEPPAPIAVPAPPPPAPPPQAPTDHLDLDDDDDEGPPWDLDGDAEDDAPPHR